MPGAWAYIESAPGQVPQNVNAWLALRKSVHCLLSGYNCPDDSALMWAWTPCRPPPQERLGACSDAQRRGKATLAFQWADGPVLRAIKRGDWVSATHMLSHVCTVYKLSLQVTARTR